MSKTIYEDEDVILTRFCGPNGKAGYQLTTNRGVFKLHKNFPEYISVVIESGEGY